MRLSLRLKLFIVLLLVAAAAVAGMALFAQWSFEKGFVRLVEARQREQVAVVVERLAEEYTEAGGWQRVRADRARWVATLFSGRPGDDARPPRWARRLAGRGDEPWPPPRELARQGRDGRQLERGDEHARGPLDEHARGSRDGEHEPDERRRVPLELRMMLLDEAQRVIIGRPEQAGDLDLHAITVSGRTVGHLGVLRGPALNVLAEVRFLDEQKRAFMLIAAIVVLVAGALALPLAGAMTARIRRLAHGAQALAAGRFDTRVSVDSGDELGRLAGDFNDLAAALARTESARRQWVVDISHELRTPIAVLRAELEALQDGVRPLDARAVDALHADVLRLGRLVDDLYDLARSDLGALSYRKSDLNAVAVLADDLDALAGEFRERGIHVELLREAPASLRVHADADRLSQLFRNLLTNTLRYTDTGGLLRVRASLGDGQLVLDFEDSAPGVPAADLARLFERFHRVERSRSRDSGGAGLGLAICRNIAAAHGGSIEARASSLGGLWVQLTLPVQA